jgi:cell division transport system permease protein
VTRFRYLLGEAADNIKVNRTTTVLAVATTTFTMLGMGVFLLLYLNAQEALGSLKDEIKVIVYLRDAVSSGEIAQVRSELSREPAVAAVEFVSREQALAAFRTQFPSEERLLKGLGDNPFPASLVVQVGPAYRSSEQVGMLVQKLKALAEVDEVLYSQDWIDNLAVAVRYLQVLGMGIGVVLAASMVTILANTIKLTLYARREEIEILKLIGATTGFIKMPFVLEGALLGGAGAACSLLLLRALFGLAESRLALKGTFWGVGRGLAFLPDRVTVAFLLLGVTLGCLGSLVSLIQFRDERS